MGKDQLTLKPYFPEHYPLLCEWWDSHGSLRASRSDLESGIGLVAESDSRPIGACFLYVTGALGFIEAMVISPDSTVSKSRKIADTLFKELHKIAKAEGVNKLIAFVQSKGMVRECSRSGFTQVGPPMAQMVQTI